MRALKQTPTPTKQSNNLPAWYPELMVDLKERLARLPKAGAKDGL
jgi:hypothetical protein